MVFGALSNSVVKEQNISFALQGQSSTTKINHAEARSN